MKKPGFKLTGLPSSATRTLPFILFGLAVLALAGCAEVVVGGTMYATKPWGKPPADTEHSIQPHESWCYETLGNVECYTHAQDVEPDRLVNVDPPNRYPLTPQAYANEIHPPPPPPMAVPLAPPADLPVIVTPAPLVGVQTGRGATVIEETDVKVISHPSDDTLPDVIRGRPVTEE